MEGEETFDSSLLGQAEEVVEERVADDDVIMIKGTKTTSAVGTILLSCSFRYLDLYYVISPYMVQFNLRQFHSYLYQVSLVLRGANDYMLDEMERALHDALCIVKRTLESNTVRLLEYL